MIVSVSVRRVGAALIGVAGAAVFAVGCSSSSNGTPITGGSNAVQSSAAPSTSSVSSELPSTLPSTLPSVSASIPTGLPSSAPVLGGSSPFCKAFSGADMSDLGASSSGDISKLVRAWDKLAAAAPSDIKSDVQLVDDFLHGVQGGNPDASKAQQIGTAVGHITTWVTTNCH